MPTGGAFNCPSGTGPVVDSELRILCDGDGTEFLRRYTIDGSTVTFVDSELDAQTSFTPIGEVGVCGPTSSDESPGEPCDSTTPLSTVGLCLADGSPIAIVATRGCDGAVTQDGWINLTTGAFSAGAPPVGTVACGQPQSIQVSGTFCDLDADGNVLGLVLIEYQYNPDGSIASVQLLDATTGQPYTVQGDLSTCPAGVEQPDSDLTVLCDANGVQFVRDYRRDENGVIVGHSDYDLDGATYTPTGTVTLCDLTQPDESPAETCLHCNTLILCHRDDQAPGDPETIGESSFPANNPLGNGVTWQLSPLPTIAFGAQPARWNWNHPASTFTFDQPVDVSWTVELTAAAGEVDKCVRFPEEVVVDQLDPNHTYSAAARILCANEGTSGRSTFSLAGVTEFTVERLGAVAGLFVDTVTVGPVAAGAAGTPFLRRMCHDCSGNVASVTDTDLDGNPITVTGTVGVCGPTGGDESPGEQCRNTSTLLVCDLPTDGEPEPTVTDTDPTPYEDACPGCIPNCGGGGCLPVPNAAQLWGGGAVQFGPDPQGTEGNGRVHRLAAATIQADRPGCDTGTATVTVSVRVRNDGPSAGRPGVGGLLIMDADTITEVGEAIAGPAAPVGHEETLTVSVDVDAVKLAAGEYVAVVNLETFDAGTKAWTVDQFDVAVEFDQTGCAAQVLANVVTDCETGQVESVIYTDMQGNPYTPTGEIGQCVPATPAAEPCGDTEVITLCDLGDPSPGSPGESPGEPATFLRRLTFDCDGRIVSTEDLTLDGAPYTPLGEVGVCGPTGDPEPCRNTSSLLVCDIPADGVGGDAVATDTDPTPYPFDGNPVRCVNPLPGGAQTLWDGGSVVVPITTGGCHPAQTLVGAAATLQAAQPACDDGTVEIAVSVRITNDGPNPTAGNYAGGFRLHRTDTGERLGNQSIIGVVAAGESRTLTVTRTVPAALLSAGDLVAVWDVESSEALGANNPGSEWTVDRFTATYTYGIAGCETQVYANVVVDCETGAVASVTYTDLQGNPYTPTGEIGQCQPVMPSEQPCQDCETIPLCDFGDESPGESPGAAAPVPFLRTVCRNCDGQIASVLDTTLDGGDYAASANVGVCWPVGAAEPCRDTNTLLVCDVEDQGQVSGALAATSVADPSPFNAWRGYGVPADTWCQENGNPGTLFGGGSTTLGPGAVCPVGGGTHEVIAATIDDPGIDCADVTVTASVRVTNNGPAAGYQNDGRMALWNTATQTRLALAAPDPSAPVGHVQTVTVSTTVSGADLAAGAIAFSVDLEVEHQGAKSWTVDEFTASYAGTCIVTTQFLRNVTVDCETGQVVATVDTTLDGGPYTPAGEVGGCETGGGKCCPSEPCRNATSLLLCDLGDTPEQTEPIPFPIPDGPTQGILPNGVAWTVDSGTWSAGPGHYGVRPPGGAPPNGPQTWTFDQPVRLRFGMSGLNGDSECVELPAGVDLVSLGASHTWDPVTRMLCGPVGSTPQQDTSVFETPAAVTSLTWQSVGDPLLIRGVAFMEVTVGVPPVQFLRTVTVDCDGNLVATTDTTLDGQPFTPTGDVAQCEAAAGGPAPPTADVVACGDGKALLVKVCDTDESPGSPGEEPCRSSSSLLLCDLPTDGVEGDLTATDTTTPAWPPANPGPAWQPLAGGGAALWGGGSLVFPADPDGSGGDGVQVYRGVAADLAAIAPACNDGTVELTLSVQVTNDGPNPGAGYSGHLALLNGGVLVVRDWLNPAGAPYPPGFTGTLTVTTIVPSADLAAGNIVAGLWLETFHGGGKQWTADQFTASYTYGTAGCATQFLRTVTTDCDGNVVAVTDTTLDGDPYTPTGDVGECQPITPDPCQVASTFQRCMCDDLSDESPGEIVSYQEVWAVDCQGQVSLIHSYRDDPGAPYEPLNPVPCDELETPGDPIVGVQTHRAQLNPGDTWEALADGGPLLQSVTVTNVSAAPATITTADGTSTLFPAETVTFSVQKESDLTLRGPLTVTADAGSTVTVAWTEAVT